MLENLVLFDFDIFLVGFVRDAILGKEPENQKSRKSVFQEPEQWGGTDDGFGNVKEVAWVCFIECFCEVAGHLEVLSLIFPHRYMRCTLLIKRIQERAILIQQDIRRL
jgi:hypothetical protein